MEGGFELGGVWKVWALLEGRRCQTKENENENKNHAERLGGRKESKRRDDGVFVF